ncbi:unnamed protein product [Vitrella brassicaformis CCMP3155]|uniref:RNA helicase n=2 Tax=Vitrella brassicaformis TaxID=1169539 RepID=A0A0G4ET85_VITBC|nr:unnamed protein product [Vitrella brassicaformis CCMP3155]|eukprot:CEM01514.1 unnamed protein product [Vitrella brassicaformis CCMP3155]
MQTAAATEADEDGDEAIEVSEEVSTSWSDAASSSSDDELFFSRKQFADIGASDEMIEAMSIAGAKRPSKIQALSYRTVLSGKNCVVADQTGSGKTLAYLAPLLQRLRDEERAGKPRALPGSPRVVVLAPTTELASQVSRVLKKLTAVAPVRTACVTGGYNARDQMRMVERSGVDILVATPGRLRSMLQMGKLNLHQLSALVLDEVDVLFLDDTFLLQPIGEATAPSTQFVFVTATIPTSVFAQIKQEFPDLRRIMGPGLHRIAPGVEEVLVDCSGPKDEAKNEFTAFERKRKALAGQLDKVVVPRTLIFCNSIENCRRVENALRRLDRGRKRFQVLPYHSGIDNERRREIFNAFTRENFLIPMVLVSTDQASRGVDFDQVEVGHVILFDFPRDPSEYVRRVGRTARAGRAGRVTSLVLGRQVSLARELMEVNRRGERIHDVPK